MDRVVDDIIHPIACGLDVHSAMIAACLVRPGPRGGPHDEERSFSTTLRGLRELRDWLVQAGCESVGMEATGVYWIPVYAVLEGHVPMVVGNPNHMRNLRGRKTDRRDARWIAGLSRHDLIRPSFVPKAEFRDARELTRSRRQLVNARTGVRNEITRLLARQGLPIGAEGLLSDIFGTSRPGAGSRPDAARPGTRAGRRQRAKAIPMSARPWWRQPTRRLKRRTVTWRGSITTCALAPAAR